MKVFKDSIITLTVIVVAALLALGCLGFMPGISSLFGSDKPRDLGVTFTSADYAAARLKAGLSVLDRPADTTSVASQHFDGLSAVNVTFTQSEFNALMNKWDWPCSPVRDLQLRVNQDDTIEFSAVLIKNRLNAFAQALEAPEDVKAILADYSRYGPGKLAIYARGRIAVVDGKISQSIDELCLGRLNITGQFRTNSDYIVQWVEYEILTLPGMNIRSVQFIDGQVHFEGNLPDMARVKG